nr:reverse transcriptase domain-containing protein [Tanacetum cinerariifolium]
MRTRSSSNLPIESPHNPSTSNPKRRNCRRSKQPFILEKSPIDTMDDQRTMAELLCAPTEGYAEAIVVPPILAEQFSLKHSLINMMNPDQFFGLEWDNPHNHIRCDANSSSSEIAKLTHAVNQQTIDVTTAMTAILKQFQATSPPASVKDVEEIYVTCGGAHPYYQCLAADGNTFLKLRDNIQGYVAAATVNYNQGNAGYRPLGTARALIDVYREEMILYDGDERLTLNMRHDTSSYSNQPQKESINMINIFNDSSEDFLENLFETNHQSGNLTFSSHQNLTSPEVKDDVFDPEGCNFLLEKLLDLDPTKDLHPPHNVNPLSGSTTSSSSFPNQLLEEFADELTLITFPPGNDDLSFDIESDLKEIEYLLHHDPIKNMNSILEDSIDQNNLIDLYDNLVDSMPKMFTNEHALDYSSPLLYDEYDDDLFEVESDTKYVYYDPFDSKGEKIKESKLLIDELDLPSDFLSSFEYDSFPFEDFYEVDALPLTNNEDKVFNPGILIREKPF